MLHAVCCRRAEWQPTPAHIPCKKLTGRAPDCLTSRALPPPRVAGFCDLGAGWQVLESGDLRRCLALPPGMSGVYITRTEPLAHAAQVLQVGGPGLPRPHYLPALQWLITAA